MKAVGIKNLKNDLSRYLQMVRKGERIYVTDRDEIIAEIHKPTTPLPPKISRWEAFLNEGAERGVLIRAKRKESTAIFQPKIETPPDIDWQGIIDDVRSDRY